MKFGRLLILIFSAFCFVVATNAKAKTRKPVRLEVYSAVVEDGTAKELSALSDADQNPEDQKGIVLLPEETLTTQTAKAAVTNVSQIAPPAQIRVKLSFRDEITFYDGIIIESSK
ncbi:MAG: hypothetical protein AB7F43_11000 [Bacteriovoracia bacterium]